MHEFLDTYMNAVVVVLSQLVVVIVTTDVEVIVGRGSAFWQKLVIPPNSVKPANAGSFEQGLRGGG